MDPKTAAFSSTPLETIVPFTGSDADATYYRPVRSFFDIRSFGCNVMVSNAVGDYVISPHVESADGAEGTLDHEELFLVHDGHARFTVGGEEFDAPRGTLVHVRDPGIERSAIAVEAPTVVFCIGGRPGHAFEVSPWEVAAASSTGE